MGVPRVFRPAIGFAFLIGTAVCLPQAALAFETTGNAVADAILASLEATGAKNLAVDDVAVSGSQIVMRGLAGDYEEDGETGSLKAESMAFSDASVGPDGSVSASALAVSGLSLVQSDNTVEIAATAMTNVRMPSPAEIEDPAKAMNKPPAFTEMEMTGLTITTEGEGTVPIERVTSSFEPIGTDGSAKGALTVEHMEIDPEGLEDKEFAERLTKLGYETVVLDVKMMGEWSAASGSATLHDFQISGADMGTLHLSGQIDGVTPAVLEQLKAAKEDMSQTMALLQQLSIVGLRVHFENDSVVERVLDQQAEEAQTDRAGLVDQLSSALPNILGLLRNPAFQQKVADAVVTFLKQPGTLTAAANPAAPVPMTQVVGAAMVAPQTIPDILSVEITANR